MKLRWALVVMGMWLMGTIATSVVATENFYTVDRMLAASTNVQFSKDVQTLGHPQTRELLRYLSSELNRLYFRIWNVAQLVIGGLVLWLIAGSTKQGPAYISIRRAGSFGPASLVIAMLAVVVVMLAYLTPAIVSLGRELDFVPHDPAPPGMSRFWILHAAYTTLADRVRESPHCSRPSGNGAPEARRDVRRRAA
ncbi:MAG: hypothetical protein HY048_13495 [Acidobacteria bacterium]|nr:hypothetical protein [Acidobacteriota bacterium]